MSGWKWAAKDPFAAYGNGTREGDFVEGATTKKLLNTNAALGMGMLPATVGSGILGALENRANRDLGQKIRDTSPVYIGRGDSPEFIQKGQVLPTAKARKDGVRAIQDAVRVPDVLSHTPSILAHEMGHHEVRKHPLGRLIQNPVTIRAGGLAPAVGLAAGAASGFSDDPDVRRAAVVAPLALSAPQLAHEAVATGLGLRRMRRQGASWGQVARGLGTLLPAQATYGMRAAQGSANALLAQRGTTFLRDARAHNAEKEADLKENFFDKVEKGDGKWRWTAAVNSDGYPKIKDDGKLRLASHVALELTGRAPPRKGQVTMHRDNDLANIHPSNLRVGTQGQNLKMMRDQGRDRPRGVDQEPDDPKYREKKAFLYGLLEGIRRATG